MIKLAQEQTLAHSPDPVLEAVIASRIYDRLSVGPYVGYYGYYGGVYGYGYPAYYPTWSTTVHTYDNEPFPSVYSYYPADVVSQINTLKAYHDTFSTITNYVANANVKKVTDIVTDQYNKATKAQKVIKLDIGNQVNFTSLISCKLRFLLFHTFS